MYKCWGLRRMLPTNLIYDKYFSLISSSQLVPCCLYCALNSRTNRRTDGRTSLGQLRISPEPEYIKILGSQMNVTNGMIKLPSFSDGKYKKCIKEVYSFYKMKRYINILLFFKFKVIAKSCCCCLKLKKNLRTEIYLLL